MELKTIRKWIGSFITLLLFALVASSCGENSDSETVLKLQAQVNALSNELAETTSTTAPTETTSTTTPTETTSSRLISESSVIVFTDSEVVSVDVVVEVVSVGVVVEVVSVGAVVELAPANSFESALTCA